MARALVNYPGFGSLWLEDAVVEDEFVVGLAWDSSGAGYPAGYQGQPVLMNFPVTCVRKWADA